MTHDEYAALVSRLEAMASAHPVSYRLRVGALAVLGYAYIAAVMLFLLSLLALIVWALVTLRVGGLVIKAVLPLLALLGALGRALWVTVPPPEGRELRRHEVPELFTEIDAVRRAARAPAPHRVIVTDELNASVSQVPRLGIFGWHRNYLSVGLPLLAALTPEQFQSVLAHEFGHLSRAHARFANWIYRVRGAWAQVVEAVTQRRSTLGALLVNRFVEWYGPYFGAYSFVLARRHEVEADRTSAAVVGSTTTAMALAALDLRGRYRSEIVWPLLTARIADEPAPPRAAFAGIVQAMPAALPLPSAAAWLESALRVESGVDDPHPALADRLEALGARPTDDAGIAALAERLALPIDPAATAAARYLGPLAARLADELDEQWRGQVSARWRDRHRHLVRARDGLRELAARAESTELTADERFRVADWTEDVHGAEAALPLVTALVRDEPRHASGLFMLGRLLLARGDDAGIAHLERAMEVDPGAIMVASSMIAGYLEQTGRSREAIAYRTRADASAAEASAARAERQSIARSEKVESAALDDAARARLREQLARYPRVGRAWIARKVTRHAPDRPFYLLGISRAEPWWRFVSEGSSTYLVRKLVEELELPGHTLVVVLTRKRAWLRRRLKRIRDAEVYRRRA
ncbi:MAG TPA: M48 family metallopeptidase [Gemmatimonadaceae bacterium]|nr:M48 family metallopeptidase [Gemmatimonadaceae bacterium]